MPKFCTKCGNKLEGNPSFCPECGHSINSDPILTSRETKVENLPQPQQPQTGEIKCPFCNKFFSPPKSWKGEIESYKPSSTSGNIVRGAVFLPWGVVSALKNKPYIQCPHCKMKIMQG